MLDSLRNRLIFSQALTLLLIIPLMGLGLIYTIERQFLIPQMAQNLLGNARMLAEISSAEFELWGNPVLFKSMVSRVKIDPALRVMFLSPGGLVLYSSDPADAELLGERIDLPELDTARGGEEVALTNYSILRLHNVVVDVLEPVPDASGIVIGVVRVTYRVASLYELFSQMRLLVMIILALGLLLSLLLGTWQAISISRPVQQVTQAVNRLANGQRREIVTVKGPRELRSQITAVNHLVEQLSALEKARRQLLANLVHELGRPLGAVRSAIRALSQGAAQDAQLLDDLVSGMDMETGRMQHLLEDLNNLYDMALGGPELQREPLRLETWLPDVLRNAGASAREKGLEWQVQIAPHLPVLSADPLRLVQIIGNLLANAIKYTPSGGKVQITAESTGEVFRLQISDNGPGIPPEEQEHIFEPFYRGSQGRRIQQGMGLDLSIARDLAAAHGGRIELNSTPGQGSVFSLILPL